MNAQKVEAPTVNNTVMKPEHVISKPVFVSKKAASSMFGVSKSTIYKWCEEANESGDWPTLFIRPSATVTLIHVETMEKFLRSKNKAFL